MHFDMNNRTHMLYLTVAVLAVLVIVLAPYFQPSSKTQPQPAEEITETFEEEVTETPPPPAAPSSGSQFKLELPKIEFPKIELPKIEFPKIELPQPTAQAAAKQLPKTNPSIAQPLVPGECPKADCRAWISGSCSKAGLYRERECYRYGPFPECKETIYYESKIEAGAC